MNEYQNNGDQIGRGKCLNEFEGRKRKEKWYREKGRKRKETTECKRERNYGNGIME